MDIAPLAFTAIGLPAPQGSKRHVGNGVMIEMSKRLPAWRQDVIGAASMAVAAHPSGLTPVFGRGIPVELYVVFRRPPTAAARKLLEKGIETVPATPPDSSKLVRGLEDACTIAGVWADDGQVADTHCYRRWAWGNDLPGASVVVQLRDLARAAAQAAEATARCAESARQAIELLADLRAAASTAATEAV